MFKDDKQNDHFRNFVATLESLIEERTDPHKTPFQRFVFQKAQVERLVSAEESFRKLLVAHGSGAAVYEAFIDHVHCSLKNILLARPYFRARQTLFAGEIAAVIRERDVVALSRYPMNSLFVRYVAALPIDLGSDVRAAVDEVDAARRDLIEVNLPLAISRARLFFARTPRSHLEYMDLLQAAVEGLMSAVDKYVIPETGFSTSFRSVACGRMTGRFIDDYNETLVGFRSNDRRRLYRAHKCLVRSEGDVDYERVAYEVNRMGEDKKDVVTTTASEIAGLLAAASTVSFDPVAPATSQSAVYGALAAAPESLRPDVQFEQAEARRAVAGAVLRLSILQQKVLRMRGMVMEDVA